MILVYTAIFGEKDFLFSPINFKHDSQVEYLCFSDKIFKSDVYKVVEVERVSKDFAKSARYYKVMGFEGIEKYDFAIWHDASNQIDHQKITELTSLARDVDFATFSHPLRNCVYQECYKCIEKKKDYSLRILMQAILLFFKSYPKESGLFETSILVKNIRRFENNDMKIKWWKWIKLLSRRDQLSIGISVKESQASYNYLDGDRENNPYSIFKPHLYSTYKDRSLFRFTENRTIRRIALMVLNKMVKS